jgi:hypothetical protein
MLLKTLLHASKCVFASDEMWIFRPWQRVDAFRGHRSLRRLGWCYELSVLLSQLHMLATHYSYACVGHHDSAHRRNELDFDHGRSYLSTASRQGRMAEDCHLQDCLYLAP